MALSSGSEVSARGPEAAITKDTFVDVHKVLGDSQFHSTDVNIFLPSSTLINSKLGTKGKQGKDVMGMKSNSEG